MPSLQHFLQFDTTIIRAFSLELLKAAIRAKNLDFAMQIHAAGGSFDDIREEAMRVTGFEFQDFVLSTLEPRLLGGECGGRLLRMVAETGNVVAAKTLIDNNAMADIPFSTKINITTLHAAVAHGNLAMVKCLVMAGADVNRESGIQHYSKSPLGLAVDRSRVDIAEYLLEHKAELPTFVDGHPSLQLVETTRPQIYDMLSRKILTLQKSKRCVLSTGDIISAAKYTHKAFSAFILKNDNISSRLLEESLVAALESMETRAVMNLLQQGADPNGPHLDWRHKRPIAAALLDKTYCLHYTDLLVQYNLDVDVDDVFEEYLCERLDTSDPLLLDSFVRAGYDLAKHGPKLFEVCVDTDSISFLMLLLDRGCPINSYGLRCTALQAAAFQGTLQLVCHLVDRGANVNSPAYTIDGFTALQGAACAKRDSAEKIEFLLSVGADIHAPRALTGGMTALEATVRPWTSLNLEYDDGYLARPGLLDIFKLLLSWGAPVNRPDGSASPLLHDIIALDEFDILESALESGAHTHYMWQVEEYRHFIRSPLQLAAERGNIRIVELLLKHGADPNASPAPNHGRTALQAAASAEEPNIIIIQLLLDNEASVNAAPAPVSGITALQGAAIRGHINIALVLMEQGAEVNAIPALKDGRTAIEGAAEHGRLDMVQMLLNVGATGDVVGKKGLTTAIELAKEHKHMAVAALLEGAESSRRERAATQ
jgi:ankyrin repeat protein